jgi:protocadherin gamma subfamily A/protocadherin delta 1/protocadherin delta 2
MDERSGALYLTEQPIDLDSVWNERASDNNLITRVTVVARDEAGHTASTTLSLHFVRFIDADHVVRFDQTRYHFQVVESLAANETIGYVNSARYYSRHNGTIIYDIIDGDDLYDEFRLDYQTGRLFSLGRLDFEQKQNYTLGLSSSTIATFLWVL